MGKRTRRGVVTPPYEATTDRKCVGADDPVRPNGNRSAVDRADTPRALVPIALVVSPYEAGTGRQCR